MTDPINYTIYKDGEERVITITPVNQNIPGGDVYVTGVFRLTEGEVGMGDIIFDDNMNQWEYTGMGDLSHQDAAEIAGFIQEKNATVTNNNEVN
jgi:hypothetical protein